MTDIEVIGKLVKKNFTDSDGHKREYYVLSIPLFSYDGTEEENIEITIKSDKAKLILMSESLKLK